VLDLGIKFAHALLFATMRDKQLRPTAAQCCLGIWNAWVTSAIAYCPLNPIVTPLPQPTYHPAAYTGLDVAAMRLALTLAALSIGLSEPNPRVGCVITSAEGRVIGRGHTQQAGGPHAEIMAMRDAQDSGESLHGASAYVTLEPCAHHGRTPPCHEALIRAGIARVVAAVQDPNPLVAGQGLAQLQAAGVRVQTGLLAFEAMELNIGFFSRMQRQTPWVRLKSALSLDGTTALHNGASQWITSPGARRDGHLWRKRAGAVLTGIGTVLQDNPRLDVRLVDTAHQPLRIVIDSKLQTPPQARMLTPPGQALIYTTEHANPALATALTAQGAQIIRLPSVQGHVDLQAVCNDLAQRHINELHIEAGATLSGAFIAQHLVDEHLLYLAPKLLGPGHPLATLKPLTDLASSTNLVFHSIEKIDTDLRILARRAPA
jgi:diaminohydroxyphosphoribosylaminopyrimidine deaminase / 5-amino-6-(5-phosphoribosylamino)uracil reductase